MRPLCSALLVITILTFASVSSSAVHAISAAPQNTRLFYFSTPGRYLSTSFPVASGPGASGNLSGSRIGFIMPSPLLAPVAVSGSVTFFLWINNTSTAPVAVTGSFDYLLPGAVPSGTISHRLPLTLSNEGSMLPTSRCRLASPRLRMELNCHSPLMLPPDFQTET